MYEALDQLWKSLDAIVIHLEASPVLGPLPGLSPHEAEAYRAMNRAGSAIIDARNAINQQLATEASATPLNHDTTGDTI